VPIVEPDLGRKGHHPLERAQAALEACLDATYNALRKQGVWLEATILKCSMATAGSGTGSPGEPQRVS